MHNLSPRLDVPWIDAVYTSLDTGLTTDIAIIWWGIAGCMSAYFLLHNTDRTVTLIEWERIARGATWHNAGQIDVFFETPVGELLQTYGEDLTRDAYQAMIDAWRQLEEIIQTIERQWQYVKYIGYNTFTTRQQLREVCKEIASFDALWLEINELFVDQSLIHIDEIPLEYRTYINLISREQGNQYIGSETTERICFEATHYATLNSAALCHAVVQYLCRMFSTRFSVYEETMISLIETTDVWWSLKTVAWQRVTCQDCILATNAYAHHTIHHHTDIPHTQAIAWYMTAYSVPNAKAPMTICVQPAQKSDTSWRTDDYYYHSARHMVTQDFAEHTMVCVGWPDVDVNEAISSHVSDVPSAYAADLDRYTSTFYGKPVERAYQRWGIMAYTDTGMRKIWAHPTAPHIRYSVGCNGVGILSSIHGWRKLSQLLQGIRIPQSIFDIR
jgi:glycine/D-amino acid oxidase-like deaminating enzyme